MHGPDVLAVREAARFAREYCLSGRGPIVLEIDNYRFEGYSASDAGLWDIYYFIIFDAKISENNTQPILSSLRTVTNQNLLQLE